MRGSSSEGDSGAPTRTGDGPGVISAKSGKGADRSDDLRLRMGPVCVRDSREGGSIERSPMFHGFSISGVGSAWRAAHENASKIGDPQRTIGQSGTLHGRERPSWRRACEERLRLGAALDVGAEEPCI